MLDIVFDANSVKCVAFDKFVCFLVCLTVHVLSDFRISRVSELIAIISQDSMDSERHFLN